MRRRKRGAHGHEWTILLVDCGNPEISVLVQAMQALNDASVLASVLISRCDGDHEQAALGIADAMHDAADMMKTAVITDRAERKEF